MPKLFADRIFW